jgi:hypothetical protein
MGIGISFRGKKKKLVFNKINFSEMAEAINSLTGKYEYNILQHEDNYFTLEFCPAGSIDLQLANGIVMGDSQTNIAGPGFHKQVADFIVDLGEELKLSLKVEDETSYWVKRDFELLRSEHVGWLKLMLTSLSQMESKDILVSWPLNSWRPSRYGGVITPMGRIKEDYLNWLGNTERIDKFAEEYFIWYNEKKDEYFHRAVALYMMWNDFAWVKPRDEEEEQRGRKILQHLEKARNLNSSLELPEREMKELYFLLGMKEEQAWESAAGLIGYRREDIIMPFPGRWEATLPGTFMVSQEEDDYVYWEEGRNFRLTSYRVKDGESTEFSQSLMDECADGEKLVTDEREGLLYRGKYHYENDKDGSYWLLQGEIISGKKFAVVTITWEKEGYEKWAVGAFESVKRVRESES